MEKSVVQAVTRITEFADYLVTHISRGTKQKHLHMPS
jgi:hypothetical protein